MDEAYLAALLAFLAGVLGLLNSIGFLSLWWKVGLISLFLFATLVPIVIKTITFLMSPHQRRSLLIEALLEMLTSDYYEDLCFFLWKHRLQIFCNYPNMRKVFYTDTFKLYADWEENFPNSVDLRVDRVALHFNLMHGKNQMVITDDVQSRLDSYSSVGVSSVNFRKKLEEVDREIAISYVPSDQTIKWTIRGGNMKREHHHILSCDSRMFLNATHVLENLSSKGIISSNFKARRGCLVYHNVHMLDIWDSLNDSRGRICDARILTGGKKCLIENCNLYEVGIPLGMTLGYSLGMLFQLASRTLSWISKKRRSCCSVPC